MGQLFISSKNSVRRAGVFVLEVGPPRIIRGVSLGYIGLVAQFGWGPVVLTGGTGYLPESGPDLLNQYEPAGSPRTSTGYRAIMRRKKAPWFIAGIKGSGAATATLSTAGTGGNLVVTAKYAGSLGNSIQRTIQAAASGDSTKRDIVVTLTNAVTGTTTETYRDVALNASADVSKSLLLSALTTTSMSGWPANGSANLASGTDGATVAASDYQIGLDALALNSSVTVVVVDDCGDSIRAAVNSNIVTHIGSNNDRVAIIQGNPGNTWAQVKTDVASYRDQRIRYVGNWAKVLDDSGTPQRSPISTMIATARVNVDRFVSDAWWSADVRSYYDMINSLDQVFNSGSEVIQDEAVDNGVTLAIPFEKGGFCINSDRSSSLTSGTLYMTTRWYKNYLAKSLKAGLPEYINGPNTLDKAREIKGLVDDFLEREKLDGALVESKNSDGTINPAYSTDIESENNASTQALGEFTIQIDGRNPSVLERLFLKLNVGEGIIVRD